MNWCKKEPERWKVIDARQTDDHVQTELRKLLLEKLGDKYDLDGLLDRSPT